MRVLFFLLILFSSAAAMASNFVGRVVKMENNSLVYVPFSGKEKPEDRLIKYLDQTYRVEPVTKGMKLDNGYIINTGPDSKLKVIFNNGDHIFVAPNTQYEIKWARQHLKDEGPTTMTLLRGAVRGVIEKDGPRSGMKIITKGTVMGIRGTDFQISQFRSGLTQVSVLRGQIELPQEDVQIGTGQTFIKKENNSNLSKLSKDELQVIAKDLSIKAQAPVEPELKELEEKATKVTLNDIKTYDPKAYEKIKDEKKLDSDQLALNTVKTIEATAPASKKKPQWADLIDEKDPYEKYKPKTDK